MLSKQVNKKKMGVIERLRRQGVSASPVPTSLREEEDEAELASASRIEDGTTEEEDTYGIEVPVATSARKKKTKSKKQNEMA